MLTFELFLMSFLSIQDVEQYLAEIPRFQTDHSKAADFNLHKFERFCASIGNPHDQFPSIHVAGTNGKGSTCSMLAAVYQQTGVRVGKYTSPHILQFNERFTVDGKPIPDGKLITFFQEHHSQIEDAKLTYFEISTAIAFWWFAQAQVDLGIIEVGLGGRLDATNIIAPLVSVITSISLDHTEILGDSLPEVAHEKAGIIKPNKPVVIGQLPEEARTVIQRITDERGGSLWDIEQLDAKYIADGRVSLTIEEQKVYFQTPLQAPVQALNIAIAWQVSRVLEQSFPVDIEQFKQALSRLDIGHGRFERLSANKKWYFDGAHNMEAVMQFKKSVRKVGGIKEAVLVLSLMRDKIQPKVMEEFSEFKNIYYYSLNTERGATIEEVNQWLPQVMAFPIQPSQQKQLLKEFDSELVIFAGSFYFYATVRDWIKKFS